MKRLCNQDCDIRDGLLQVCIVSKTMGFKKCVVNVVNVGRKNHARDSFLVCVIRDGPLRISVESKKLALWKLKK